ncbi:MAG: hypothetical protein JW945_05630 [Methanomicrobia archaeon]|nr:hypothetical protein [Methanomicrobia archaeon]
MHIHEGLRTLHNSSVAVFMLLMLLMLLLILTTATATTVSVGNADITEGGRTTVSVSIENAATDVSCATIVLSYDSAIARVTGFSNGDFDKQVYTVEDARGRTTIVVYQTDANGLTGTIKIGDVTLEGITAGTTSLTPQIVTLKDNGGYSLSADTLSGTLTVRSAGGSGGSSGGGSSSGGSTPTPSPTPTPSSSPSPTSTTTSAPPTATPLPSEPVDSGSITVHVDDVRAEEGEEVIVPIQISGVSHPGLSSARITLTYDPDVVTVLSAESSDFAEFMANIENGTVRMNGFQTGVEGLTGEVTFAQLQLKAIGNPGEQTTLGLDVSELVDNTGNLLAELNDYAVAAGRFTIVSADEPEPSEPSNARIPAIGAFGTLLAVITGFYLLVLLKRRCS